MLLPFLLRQHKTWKNCKLRIFTVAQSNDNSSQMQRDLEQYLYHMRIEAEVLVIQMNTSDISAYTYERTIIMELRTEFLQDMRVGKKSKHRGRRRNNYVEFETDDSLPPGLSTEADFSAYTTVPDFTTVHNQTDPSQFTYSPQSKEQSKPNEENIRRMHTAVRLNEVIVQNSHLARLVILNMPAPPKLSTGEENYMEYLEVLTEGLDTVVMVRGSGREVITMYS